MEKLNWMEFKTNTNPILDSYRSLRANLQKLTAGKSGTVLELTSALPNEAQSKVVAGLAIVLAQGGSKTLVIDGNCNAPAQHVLFDVPNEGMTDALAANAELETYVKPCMEQENLFVLPAGSASQNHGELLCGEPVQQFLADSRVAYEYVLVNVASVAESADAISFAPNTDGVLLVVASRTDHLNELKEAKIKLEQAGAKILGCILKDSRGTV